MDCERAHRKDPIGSVTNFYDRNKTGGFTRAADDGARVGAAITATPERDDPTHAQRRELAEQPSTRHLVFNSSFEDGGVVATADPA